MILKDNRQRIPSLLSHLIVIISSSLRFLDNNRNWLFRHLHISKATSVRLISLIIIFKGFGCKFVLQYIFSPLIIEHKRTYVLSESEVKRMLRAIICLICNSAVRRLLSLLQSPNLPDLITPSGPG